MEALIGGEQQAALLVVHAVAAGVKVFKPEVIARAKAAIGEHVQIIQQASYVLPHVEALRKRTLGAYAELDQAIALAGQYPEYLTPRAMVIERFAVLAHLARDTAVIDRRRLIRSERVRRSAQSRQDLIAKEPKRGGARASDRTASLYRGA